MLARIRAFALATVIIAGAQLATPAEAAADYFCYACSGYCPSDIEAFCQVPCPGSPGGLCYENPPGGIGVCKDPIGVTIRCVVNEQ
jgi:hypothetical protein